MAVTESVHGAWTSSEAVRLCTGGFTAAFLDEAFGLLFYSLRQHGLLPFISPAFTAHLDVSFKKVTPCPSVHHMCAEARCLLCRELLCTCMKDCRNGLTVMTWDVFDNSSAAAIVECLACRK